MIKGDYNMGIYIQVQLLDERERGGMQQLKLFIIVHKNCKLCRTNDKRTLLTDVCIGNGIVIGYVH